MKDLIDKLKIEKTLSREEFMVLLGNRNEEAAEYLFKQARDVRHSVYGHDVYMRGLIEFTNYCKNDCYYCGLQRSNSNARRYRLDENQILDCCTKGYKLGFRTFVLQSGEDTFYTDEHLCEIVCQIRNQFPDCAITLSIGERSYDSYKKLFEATDANAYNDAGFLAKYTQTIYDDITCPDKITRQGENNNRQNS